MIDINRQIRGWKAHAASTEPGVFPRYAQINLMNVLHASAGRPADSWDAGHLSGHPSVL